jgi:DNA polymerase elongation subunit (family B)
MIEITKKKVEENYKNAKVIYGDTDSVMVKFFDSKA